MSGVNWTQEELDAYYERLKRNPDSVPFGPDISKFSTHPTLDDPTIVIEFQGKVPSKKNRYTPNPNGKGFHKDKKLQSELDALALQIPGQYRDLMLESPEMDVFFIFRRGSWDRDNALTALIDLLVEYRVLAGDQIRRFNGRVTIHPAVKGECDGVRVVLRKAE